jgi:hypothetical protein
MHYEKDTEYHRRYIRSKINKIHEKSTVVFHDETNKFQLLLLNIHIIYIH